MSSIRGVMLLPISAKSYRSHTAHHTFLNKVNAPDTVADPNLALSRLVENRVRGEVAQQLSPTDYRVLRWEQRDIQNRFFVRFRELDGVFEAGNRTTVILEVKASASKSSIKSGLAQLRAAVKTASHAQPKIVGILAIADMGEWFDTFGPSATRPLADHFVGMDVTLLDWPPQLPEDRTDGIFVTLVPSEVAGGWLPAEPQELLQ